MPTDMDNIVKCMFGMIKEIKKEANSVIVAIRAARTIASQASLDTKLAGVKRPIKQSTGLGLCGGRCDCKQTESRIRNCKTW